MDDPSNPNDTPQASDPQDPAANLGAAGSVSAPGGAHSGQTGAASSLNGGTGALGRVPIEIVVSVGRSRPTIRELLQLQKDAVLNLDRRVSDPVELHVGDRLIARGVLEELEGAQAGLLGVRLVEVIDFQAGL